MVSNTLFLSFCFLNAQCVLQYIFNNFGWSIIYDSIIIFLGSSRFYPQRNITCNFLHYPLLCCNGHNGWLDCGQRGNRRPCRLGQWNFPQLYWKGLPIWIAQQLSGILREDSILAFSEVPLWDLHYSQFFLIRKIDC